MIFLSPRRLRLISLVSVVSEHPHFPVAIRNT